MANLKHQNNQWIMPYTYPTCRLPLGITYTCILTLFQTIIITPNTCIKLLLVSYSYILVLYYGCMQPMSSGSVPSYHSYQCVLSIYPLTSLHTRTSHLEMAMAKKSMVFCFSAPSSLIWSLTCQPSSSNTHTLYNFLVVSPDPISQSCPHTSHSQTNCN